MAVLISYPGKGRPERPKRPKKQLGPAQRDARQIEAFKSQIRAARKKFARNYDALLLYMNRMAVFAALESIGIAKNPKNRELVREILEEASADFQNLIETSETLVPDHRSKLFQLLGKERLFPFLDQFHKYRLLIFRLEDAIVDEEKGFHG